MHWLPRLGVGVIIVFVFFYTVLYSKSALPASSIPIPLLKHNLTTTEQKFSRTPPIQDLVLIVGNSTIHMNRTEQSTRAQQREAQIKNRIICDDTTSRTFYAQRGEHWVLYNYIKATRMFNCDESITYTTHADFTFLDNLTPLLERWQGPLSISLYSPGTDFMETLARISYLRECTESTLVKEFVTFHLYFDIKSMPSHIPQDPMSNPFNCSAVEENVTFGDNIITYKKSHNLTYPVNVGRMVARDMANTFYVLASDIELYPSPNLIPAFLDMIRRNISTTPTNSFIQSANHKVFVLPIFEADINVDHLPYNKRELIDMLKNNSVIPFHKYICSYCHAIPKFTQWLQQPIQQEMKIFHVGKRKGAFKSWEPIFIGTKFDPAYDERLNWEGRRDKMTQAFAMCVLDYEFHVLSSAFLIHKPGIKRPSHLKWTKFLKTVTGKQNFKVDKEIYPELKILYGSKQGCAI